MISHQSEQGKESGRDSDDRLSRRATRRAWVECRKHEPAETENRAADANKSEAPDESEAVDSDESEGMYLAESDEYRVSCSHYKDEYTPDEAGSITIIAGEVWYTCPRCGHGTNGPSPLINKD
jgi:hypothetical protein